MEKKWTWIFYSAIECSQLSDIPKRNLIIFAQKAERKMSTQTRYETTMGQKSHPEKILSAQKQTQKLSAIAIWGRANRSHNNLYAYLCGQYVWYPHNRNENFHSNKLFTYKIICTAFGGSRTTHFGKTQWHGWTKLQFNLFVVFSSNSCSNPKTDLFLLHCSCFTFCMFLVYACCCCCAGKWMPNCFEWECEIYLAHTHIYSSLYFVNAKLK